MRRPLSDQYAIRPKKDELSKDGKTLPAFYKRLAEKIKEEPQKSFFRWNKVITEFEINDFKTECFHPQLERLCDWWSWIKVDPFDPWRPRTYRQIIESMSEGEEAHGPLPEADLDMPIPNTCHYQAPWGIFNSLAAGFRGAFYDLLALNRRFTLDRVETLFPELEEP